MNEDNAPPLPFLKWAGGKRWLVSQHQDIFPAEFNRYFEPFLGSGAVFFALQPKKAFLSDYNGELIEAYKAIRDTPSALRRNLEALAEHHSSDYYYQVRDEMEFRSKAQKAARFIYLNRTCWNGLYRVNLNGKFNVPIGTKTKVIFEGEDFQRLGALLKSAQIRECDFSQTIKKTRAGDLLFVDPPYTVRHNFNGFVKYNEKVFSWDDQVRLNKSLFSAAKRGVKIILSNADHESIRALYSELGEIDTLERNSVIAARSEHRSKVAEMVWSANI